MPVEIGSCEHGDTAMLRGDHRPLLVDTSLLSPGEFGLLRDLHLDGLSLQGIRALRRVLHELMLRNTLHYCGYDTSDEWGLPRLEEECERHGLVSRHRFIVTSIGHDKVVLSDVNSRQAPYIRHTGNAAVHSSEPNGPYFEFDADKERAILNETAAELCDLRAAAESLYEDEMSLHAHDPARAEPPPKPTLEFRDAKPGWGG